MKHLLLILTFFAFSQQKLWALPVLNENVATSRVVTIYPDHKDPNRFYVAPNVMTLGLTSDGVPLFSYIEYKPFLFETHAIVQMTLKAQYHPDDLDAAMEEVRVKKPKAQFSALPFVQSKMVFGKVLKGLVEEQFCDQPAGQVGDEMACAFELNEDGRKVFRNTMKKNLSVVMNFQYKVLACLRTADNKCQEELLTFGIAARVGGEELKPYPGLFLDHRGHVIKD